MPVWLPIRPHRVLRTTLPEKQVGVGMSTQLLMQALFCSVAGSWSRPLAPQSYGGDIRSTAMCRSSQCRGGRPPKNACLLPLPRAVALMLSESGWTIRSPVSVEGESAFNKTTTLRGSKCG